MNIEWQKKISDVLSDELKTEKIMKKIETKVMATVQLRFEKETDPNGKKWKPIKRVHKSLKKGSSWWTKGKILRDSGNLIKSINSSIDKNTLTVGTNLKYARIHNEGGEIKIAEHSRLSGKRKQIRFYTKLQKYKRVTQKVKSFTIKDRTINMPKRQFLGFGNKLKKDIENIIEKELEKEIFKK
ncbi:phage virion morphogenesis protein [Streptobacillus moniliformis]|uniref:phage virion morphogenesis protein n=1 Tax=Streptobacillus moniliformis TaxID=34105 RepID=UPI0007E40329|nr:phage virion morphogenesis protein [Streptobacillus moniliformis]